MSDYEQRFAAAEAELAAAGVWASNGNPPLTRIMRRLGFKPRPPHYDSTTKIIVGFALWFGPIWGIMMWLAGWRDSGMSIGMAAISALVAGALFGAFMAIYYAHGRRKYCLSSWYDLTASR